MRLSVHFNYKYDRIVLKGAAYLKDGDEIAIAQDPVSATEE